MKSPELYTLEHSDGQNKDHTERKLTLLEESEGSDKNEKLRSAQEVLVGNIELYSKFLDAIILIDTSGNPAKRIYIENLFVSTLQDLSDSGIESVVRQFNTGFKKYVMERAVTTLTAVQKRKIFENDQKNNKEMRGNIHSNSILNIIHFIRARKQLLNVEPRQEYGFYTNDILDGHYKIDLVECLFDHNEHGELVVKTMNLIQMKSSEPDEGEQRSIIEAHREWINSSVMDFDAFEHEYSDGLPENLPIEKFTENAGEVEDLLLDLCTDPEGFNPETFLQKLDLEKLTNKQKAWILAKCAETLKQHILEAVTHGSIEQSDADIVIAKLTELEKKVRSKGKLPRNLSFVDSIHSIIAVGPKIIKDVELTSANTQQAQKKIVKYN